MNRIARFVIDARKAVASLAVGVAGVAGQVVAANVVHGTALHYTQVILAGATALGTFLGVYSAPPNGDAEGTVPAVEPDIADAPASAV